MKPVLSDLASILVLDSEIVGYSNGLARNLWVVRGIGYILPVSSTCTCTTSTYAATVLMSQLLAAQAALLDEDPDHLRSKSRSITLYRTTYRQMSTAPALFSILHTTFGLHVLASGKKIVSLTW